MLQPQTLLRQLVHSKYVDLFGALLILGVCLSRSFHETYFFNGEIQFGIPISDLPSFVKQGAFPLGILSTIGAVFSMLATRLTGKQNNWGNIIGLITTVNSGVLDYLFGNGSAVITYPLTFLIFTVAVKNWADGEKIREIDLRYYLIMFAGLVIGFALVHLGAHWFGGKTDTAFLTVVSVTFGISLGANTCNALKYKETWLGWMIYNIVQLIKNTMQMNLANVVKYAFYMGNALVTWLDWRWNGDVVTGKDS
ncbi:MAG: nicotinamide riboside transporter PnuC [Flavobacteriales bacterium]|jgi:nicotinamide riboside transporter PnuC